ncbi:hypothetical protein QBC42DRAFT_276693 [Cladorrhinum samala]|uniref:Uncharacterized protein n=1 Tax=Cladorrhinum samala TaxID=585594 RepID=A0AAV9HHD4_9PEZI|nr:hypothetical protein QBC42DRAFT_276693 [Cladorrhinum samala]
MNLRSAWGELEEEIHGFDDGKKNVFSLEIGGLKKKLFMLMVQKHLLFLVFFLVLSFGCLNAVPTKGSMEKETDALVLASSSCFILLNPLSIYFPLSHISEAGVFGWYFLVVIFLIFTHLVGWRLLWRGLSRKIGGRAS